MTESTLPESIRLLIVDDDVVDRMAIRRLLAGSDRVSKISEALTVNEGLAMCDEEPFDLILLDYRMPQRNGIEMVFELGARLPPFGGIICMMSSAEDPGLKNACLEAGAIDFISKAELDRDRLLEVISRVSP